MARYIHLFETEDEFNSARNNDYEEPWVSLTEADGEVNYNKSEDEKLPGTPLTFEITGDGNIVWKKATTATTVQRVIEYSKNDGEWIPITANTTGGTTIPVVMGDIVQFRGNNTSYGTSSYYNTFSGSTAQFKAKGNIMSLINSTDFGTLTTLESASTFYCLFSYCTGLTDASKLLLPATTLANYCYSSMFIGCTSLTQAPALPATTLAQYCYNNMFGGCASLTTVPALPATTLEQNCYRYMFQGCTSLTKAPELPATTLVSNCYAYMFSACTSLTQAPELPATTLAVNCYYYMFTNCTSLTKAPELPATTLANYCYSSMFIGCTSLTQAPALPATTLAQYCYSYMFKGCGNLNYIKCLATTSINTTNCDNWVNGVAATGTFVKAPNVTKWRTSASGIPTGWTVQDAA